MTVATQPDSGRAPGTDYLLLRSELTEEEIEYLDRTRRFVDEEVLPVMPGYWERAEAPVDLARRLGALGLGARLPWARSFEDAGRVLTSTRLTCAFAARGHAVGAFDAALSYCRERRQPGKPLVRFQIVQERLVKMLAEVTAMQLYCLRVGRSSEHDHLRDTIAGLAKMNNTTKARQVIAQTRDLLGGNGILLENHVIRHMADIEAIHTFEGTETMQTLILGRDITGVSAFA